MKAKGKPSSVPATTPEQPTERFESIRWYDVIRRDPSRLQEATDYYRRAVENAKFHITAIGHLETLVAETPGLSFFYKTIHTDAQQIRRWLEERLEVELARKHKWFMTSPEAKQEYGELKTTEAAKFAKADEQIIQLGDNIRLMAYYDHLLDDVALGFQSRSIMLSQIVAIRKEGLEEIWVDPRKETKNY